jgi:prefoldin beta subunit
MDADLKRMYEAMRVHLQTLQTLAQKKSKLVESRQQLGAQKSENELVKQELMHLEADAAVFKLVGPALVSQDVEDAKQVIGRRLEHINSELLRTDAGIEEAVKNEGTEYERIHAIENQMKVLQAKLEQQQQQAQQA